MTVSLSDLYSRLGKLMGIAKAQIDAKAAIKSRVTTLDGSYTAATRYMFTPLLNYFLNLGSSQDQSVTQSVSTAVTTLTEMVTIDNPAISKDVTPALKELQRQMVLASATLPANTITQGSVSYGSANVGTGKLLLHSIPSTMSCIETIRIECVSDVTNGTLSGQEGFTVKSDARVTDITSDLYPAGSGANGSDTCTMYGDTINVLDNGDFSTWTGTVPDSWTATYVGAGSVVQNTTSQMRGSSCIIITGPITVQLTQTGKRSVIGSGKRIICGFWAKKNTGSGALTRDIEFETTNQSGTQLGNVTCVGTSMTTTYALYTTSIVMAQNAPPTDITFQLNLTLNSGQSIVIDSAFVIQPQQYGTNGQYLQIIAGATDWRIGDYATVSIGNNYSATVSNYTERFFQPWAKGIELPTTTGTPTIANSVVP